MTPAWRPNQAVTIAGLMALTVVGVLVGVRVRKAPESQRLQDPVATLLRIYERCLLMKGLTPPWAMPTVCSANPARPLEETVLSRWAALATEARAEKVAVHAEEMTALYGRMAILAAELGEHEQMREAVDRLAVMPHGEVIRKALRQAFPFDAKVNLQAQNAAETSAPPPTAEDGDELEAALCAGRPEMESGFTGLRLFERLASVNGYQSKAERMVQAELHRGRRLAALAVAVNGVAVLLKAAGLLAVAVLWRRRRSLGALAPGCPIAFWPFASGLGALARAGVIGLVLSVVVGAALRSRYGSLPLGTTAAAIPLLWWLQRLLGGHGAVVRTFGLRWNRGGGRWLLLAVVAALAAEGVMDLVLQAVGLTAAAGSTWVEMFLAGQLWSPAWKIAMVVTDGVILAPVFEELAFRGVLYATLRRRVAVLPACLITAVLFALMHSYGLGGSLMLFGSGMVAAYLFEKTHSLWPAIGAHAVSNLLAFLTYGVFV